MTYTLTKETSLFQKDKISTDVTDAGTKATNYLKPVSTTGVYVKPQGQNPSSGSEGNSMRLDNNGLEIYVNSTSVAKYGTTARVGNTTDNVSVSSSNIAMKKNGTEMLKLENGSLRLGDTTNYAKVTSDGLKVYKGGSSSQVASFGTDVVLGKTNGINNVINSSGFAIKNSSTNISTFKIGSINVGGTTTNGTRIEAQNEIGLFANGYSSSNQGLIIAKEGGAPIFYFGDILRFCPQPWAKATSTNSNISLSSNTITSVPMTQRSYSHNLMSIKSGCIQFDAFDGFTVEVTASVYVVPSTNTQATIYLYHYDADMGTTTEVAAGSTYLSSYGGAVQLTPRIISPMYQDDRLYIAVRLFSATGTAHCNHKDTFMTVKYM